MNPFSGTVLQLTSSCRLAYGHFDIGLTKFWAISQTEDIQQWADLNRAYSRTGVPSGNAQCLILVPGENQVIAAQYLTCLCKRTVHAQAFDGLRYTGHSVADVVMFSFGPIKTATALAGGLLVVRDAALLRRMRMTHEVWPVQSHSEFRARVRTYTLLKVVSGRFTFACLVRVLRWLGKDLDATFNGAVRNFPLDRFFDSVRRRPSFALLRLIARRIRTFDVARQDRRSHIGRTLATSIQQYQKADSNHLVQRFVPSASVPRHTWWVFPFCSNEAAAVIATLRSAGFDATQGSHLQPIAAPVGFHQHHPALAARVVDTMIFLPLYPELTDFAVKQLIIAIASSGHSSFAIGRGFH